MPVRQCSPIPAGRVRRSYQSPVWPSRSMGFPSVSGSARCLSVGRGAISAYLCMQRSCSKPRLSRAAKSLDAGLVGSGRGRSEGHIVGGSQKPTPSRRSSRSGRVVGVGRNIVGARKALDRAVGRTSRVGKGGGRSRRPADKQDCGCWAGTGLQAGSIEACKQKEREFEIVTGR